MSSSQPSLSPPWAHRVASTILEQLGGERCLRLMLGPATRFCVQHDPERGAGLLVSGIDMTECGGRVTAFRVLLAPSDTYDVDVFEGPEAGLRLVDSVDDIYSDMLVECVERRTGYSLTSPFPALSANRSQALTP
ncbi:hypothetical protein [Dolichospermum phage Dfl-JY45]